jgi:peptide deformylase
MEIVLPPLKIVKYPHPSLRHPARLVTTIDAKIQRVAEEMLELMYSHRGLGLAAPQVGLPFRLFVCNHTGGEDRGAGEVYINPVIGDKQGLVEAEEGCLSFPGLYQKVRRARTCKVTAYNLKSELVELELSGQPARVWQHEVDHLDGKLFIDKFSPVGELASRGSLETFEREYRRAQKKGETPPDADIERMLTELEKLA